MRGYSLVLETKQDSLGLGPELAEKTGPGGHLPRDKNWGALRDDSGSVRLRTYLGSGEIRCSDGKSEKGVFPALN